MIAHSQLAPLPSELPFQIVSKTIGQGAYAWQVLVDFQMPALADGASSIKKGQIPGRPQIFAVKFIHKAFALRHGHVTKKQLDLEISLHKYLGSHAHIVEFFQAGEDPTWRWIAMELAEGGDLFDKIEADVGVGEDVAHLYFRQLVGAVAFMHAKGVGHRDLKPENVLLSRDGDLKIADFGLATMFEYRGQRKLCTSSCGSPPYTAPEVVACGPGGNKTPGQGYYGDLVDIWSCGIVLFVLLVGNTPWDEPRMQSHEFAEFVRSNGRPEGDELWARLPVSTLSLLRGMLRVDPASRFRLADVRSHPWFTRQNRHLGPDGRLADGVAMATDMFGRMRVDFAADPLAGSQKRAEHATQIYQPSTNGGGDAMDLDSQPPSKLASTQPDTPSAELAFDWETAPRLAGAVSASQPTTDDPDHVRGAASAAGRHQPPPSSLTHQSQSLAMLEEDPTLSQFSQSGPVLPLSCSQLARRFGDVLPSHSLTRFVSAWPLPALLEALVHALRRLNVPVADPSANGAGNGSGGVPGAWMRVRTVDDRKGRLSGDVVVESGEGGLCQVVFVKAKGDPVEWRRFFKRVVVLCEGAVLRPA